jgi:iron complex transport system permease protein
MRELRSRAELVLGILVVGCLLVVCLLASVRFGAARIGTWDVIGAPNETEVR